MATQQALRGKRGLEEPNAPLAMEKMEEGRLQDPIAAGVEPKKEVRMSHVSCTVRRSVPAREAKRAPNCRPPPMIGACGAGLPEPLLWHLLLHAAAASPAQRQRRRRGQRGRRRRQCCNARGGEQSCIQQGGCYSILS